MTSKFNIKKFNGSEFLATVAIMTLTFASGGNYYIRNIGFLACVTCMLLAAYKKVTHRYIVIFMLVTGYVLVNSILLNTSPTDYKECVVMGIRLASCMVIASCISTEQFKRIFLKLMIFLSILSLCCFTCMVFGIPLPGVELKNGLYGSFYHTLSIGTGWQLERCRNSGIFTEPGIFQIYLNIALMILWSYKEMPLRKAKKIFWLLSVTMLTTKSSMGFLIWAVVLVLFYIDRREIFPSFGFMIKRQDRVWLFCLCVLLFLVEEFTLGIGVGFIQGVNSWASRHDDTILTFLMAKDHPIFGAGIATDPIPMWKDYYDRYSELRLYTWYQDARSNGLGNLLAGAGIPFTVLYLYCIIKNYCQMLHAKKIISKILIAIIFIAFFMEEPIMPTPFFLISFYWVTAGKQKKMINIYERFGGNFCERIMGDKIHS